MHLAVRQGHLLPVGVGGRVEAVEERLPDCLDGLGRGEGRDDVAVGKDAHANSVGTPGLPHHVDVLHEIIKQRRDEADDAERAQQPAHATLAGVDSGRFELIGEQRTPDTYARHGKRRARLEFRPPYFQFFCSSFPINRHSYRLQCSANRRPFQRCRKNCHADLVNPHQ